MSGSITLPTIMGPAGLQPIPPATLLAQLLALVAQTVPDYTAQLPGSLIDDISGTDVGALVICDQARVDLINSVTPYGANAFLLNQLGQIYGVQPGLTVNTSVYVVLTGPPGWIVSPGFIVGDGTYQYVIADGGMVGSGSTTPPLLAVAVQSGSWAVPANTVTKIVTSVPSPIVLTVTNPSTGTPSAAAETESGYRVRVLQAGLVAAQGTPAYLKTLLANINGVQARLVATRQIVGVGYEVICGGGDPYQIANAIYEAAPDLSTITGSVMQISAATQANPGVVATVLNHGYATGQVVTFSGVGGMTQLNTGSYTITVIDEKTFSIGVNTSSFTPYSSGGQVLPNLRNITVSINSYPDIYPITFVNPPQQTVAMNVLWNTDAINFVSSLVVNQLAQAAIIAYINGLPVGAIINLLQLQEIVQQAIAPVLATALLTRMAFTVYINGIQTSPSTGTGIIAGDPESFFFTTTANITVAQG